MNLHEKAQLAEKAACAAGDLLLRHPKSAGRLKAQNDFVTEMDLASERLIKEILLGACPEDGFYGEEEGGNVTARGRWIVDPIDGTANFMKGQLFYTVSIAYEWEGELVVGCVYCPPTKELWIGIKGEGATYNGTPIHVSDETDPKKSFLHMSFSHRNPNANTYVMERLKDITKAYSDLRRTASAAYDLCCVAMGRCEAFFELYLYIYDIAAGIVILREAGGRISAWKKDEDPLVSGHILATNGKIHDHLQDMLLAGDLSVLDNADGI